MIFCTTNNHRKAALTLLLKPKPPILISSSNIAYHASLPQPANDVLVKNLLHGRPQAWQAERKRSWGATSAIAADGRYNEQQINQQTRRMAIPPVGVSHGRTVGIA